MLAASPDVSAAASPAPSGTPPYLSGTKDVISNSFEAAPPAAPSSTQSSGDLRNIVRRKLTGYVGFANLPNQWHRKSVRKGFNFNVMVVGESFC